jgi:Flp pilus assembly pilin Flp
MKTASVIVLIAIVLLAIGSTLNRACKSGYHAWCAPLSTLVRHHTKNRPPA